MLLLSLALLLASSDEAQGPAPRPRDLAGKPIRNYPHFQRVRTFNEGDAIHVAIDTSADPALARKTVEVYLLDHAALPQFLGGRTLESVTGRPTTITVSGDGLADNIFRIDAGSLRGRTGSIVLGRGYDVAVDVNGNKRLDAPDLLDGDANQAGFHVVQDFVSFRGPGTKETGPYAVSTFLFLAGTNFTREFIYYPTNVAELGELPLLVVSHGNGHDFRWYDHIGYHMASWGFVVMSHANNTGPGIRSASDSTLRNTNVILSRTDEIAEGALVGHIDGHRILWLGHSRGGEGVVRAYRRALNGDALAASYSAEDIRLVTSMAPTDFLGPGASDVGSVPYHLWTGGADADVNGCANCDICQTFHLLGRADGPRFGTSLHGAGHGDFHDGGGSSVAQGPCRIGRTLTHTILRGYLLPLAQYVLDGNPACQDYLTRQYEEFRPLGAPAFEELCVNVDLVFQNAGGGERFVLDDFQSQPDRARSSSGGAVLASPLLRQGLAEGHLDDGDTVFSFSEADPMNGMTWAGPGDDSSGAVFEWNGGNEFLAFEVPADRRDLRSFTTLSLRAAQSPRAPLTDAERGDLDFEIELWDGHRHASAIRVSSYGGGVEEPYRRGTCGSGNGWAAEFETLRIPLADFVRDGRRLDLSNVVGVALRFGPTHGSFGGRLGLDDLEFTRD